MVKLKKTFIIAEAGVNHNGDKQLALQMVEEAARCGADAVKFQTFKADKLVIKGADKAEYQKKYTGDGDQYSMLKSLELSEALHMKLATRCDELGIEFMSTPFDEESADFLVKLGMKRIKIPSGELTNHPLIAFCARKNLPIILSTGMSTLDEIKEAISVISKERKKFGYKEPLVEVLTLLHCTSNYPTALADVNLLAIRSLGDSLQLPIGYSDHTEGTLISVAAVAAGSVIVEKHFTLDKRMQGPDHAASIEPHELKELVAQVRMIDIAMGDGFKAPTESELPVRALVRRSVTVNRALSAGQVITRADLVLLRPGTGIEPKDLEKVVGRRMAVDISEGATLNWADIL